MEFVDRALRMLAHRVAREGGLPALRAVRLCRDQAELTLDEARAELRARLVDSAVRFTARALLVTATNN